MAVVPAVNQRSMAVYRNVVDILSTKGDDLAAVSAAWGLDWHLPSALEPISETGRWSLAHYATHYNCAGVLDWLLRDQRGLPCWWFVDLEQNVRELTQRLEREVVSGVPDPVPRQEGRQITHPRDEDWELDALLMCA